jgi:hypothetical protein
MHRLIMRTTVTLDDDIYAIAMSEASRRHLSLGKAISDLARKGAKVETKLREKGGLILPELPDDSPRVDMARVRQLENEE